MQNYNLLQFLTEKKTEEKALDPLLHCHVLTNHCKVMTAISRVLLAGLWLSYPFQFGWEVLEKSCPTAGRNKWCAVLFVDGGCWGSG